MDRPSLYDDDIVTWAEEQAAALRALGARADLSNAVDWENVAEEIASVGRSELRAIESLIKQMLVHLLKHLSAPDLPTSVHWREEIATFHSLAEIRYERAMRQRIDVDKAWRKAKVDAQASLTIYGDRLVSGLPAQCPLDIDDLLEGPLDIDALNLKIAQSTKSA